MILSGGSGTRLWPLSTPEVPKQFADLFDGRTLFGMTMSRLADMEGLRPAIVVTGSAHRDLVEEEVASSPVPAGLILVEPKGRNTAPAVIAAALAADPEDVLVILPSDHLISDVGSFRHAVQVAASLAAHGGVVTFGIRPTRPETGYGYIEFGEAVDDGFRVDRFKEKPDELAARTMSTDGRHLWNSGMFVARADHVLEEAEAHVPELVEGVKGAMSSHVSGVVELGPGFAGVESISFDHAIMERTSRALVVPIDVGWNDVGSFVSLLAASDLDDDGNHVAGDVVVDSVHDSFLKATSRRLVVAGMDHVVVVETPDAVLVIPLEMAQRVKELQQRPGAS